MPFVELVFPHFSQNKEGEDGQAEYIPKLLKLLKGRGVFHGHRGLILKQNGEDVTAAQRKVMLLQWPNKEAFFAFAASADYRSFGQAVKPFSVKAPDLHLVETQPKGLEDLRKFPFLGLTMIKPGKGDTANVKEQVERGAEAALGSGSLYGVTLNLDEDEIVLVEGFADVRAFDTAQTGSSRASFLSDIRKRADVSEILTQIEAISELP